MAKNSSLSEDQNYQCVGMREKILLQVAEKTTTNQPKIVGVSQKIKNIELKL